MKKEYYHTKESVAEYVHLAKDVNGGELIEKLKSYLPLDSKLLELGSGPGSDWKILNETFDVTGSDYSAEFLNHLSSQNPEGEFLELDATTLQTEQKFDGIYSNKVLHHLSDNQLKASILRQHQILNEKGIICHSFWKGEDSEIFKGLFVNYHDEKAIERFFTDKFDILVLETYAEFDEGDSILLIGKRKTN